MTHPEAMKLSPQANPRFRPQSVVFSVASRSAAGQSMIERSHSAIKRAKILNVRSGPAKKNQIDSTQRVSRVYIGIERHNVGIEEKER